MTAAVIYGTDTGNTRDVAHEIAAHLHTKAIEVTSVVASQLKDCDLLVFGTPTSGYGDLQADWSSRLRLLSQIDFTGKLVALFGLGDQLTYADTFADAVGELYEYLLEKGATVIGQTLTSGYDFFSSRAVVQEMFVGLILDQENQRDETGVRISAWTATLKQHLVTPSVPCNV